MKNPRQIVALRLTRSEVDIRVTVLIRGHIAIAAICRRGRRSINTGDLILRIGGSGLRGAVGRYG